ncbi:hypothetical protein Efla_000708 [Eimeria flavescens]
MGQDQSTVLNDVNIDETEARVRPRNKKVTTRHVKTVLAVAQSVPLQFMGRAEVVDHIKPIREAAPGVKEEIESYEGIMDLAAQLKEKKKKREELIDLRVMELPEIEAKSVSESEEEETIEERGIYHKVVSADLEPTSIMSETAHPVSIEGECAVSCILKFRDDSPFSREFPVHKIEWVESLSIGDSSIFSIAPLESGSSDTVIVIPADLLGKFIAVKAHRRVEDQFERTKLGDTQSGMYDPHIGGARTAKTQAPKQYVTVVSTAISGPVLLAEDTATLILKALTRGGFSCAVKLRDVLDSADRAVPLEKDPVKAAKAKNKIPATLLVDGGTFELRYLKSYIALDEDGIIRPNIPKGQAAEAASSEFVNIEQTLDLISVRPSKGPQTLVVALEFKAHGYKSGGTQQLIRFDVDPAVGRDLALHHCLAFQAARRARLTRNTCEAWYNTGNVEAVRRMVQDFLEAQATEISEASPAFEKMATTPWSVLNYRPLRCTPDPPISQMIFIRGASAQNALTYKATRRQHGCAIRQASICQAAADIRRLLVRRDR